MVQWKVIPEFSSYYYPILYDIVLLSLIFNKPSRTFLNFRKAICDSFTTKTEEYLATFSTAGHRSQYVAVGKFNEIIQSVKQETYFDLLHPKIVFPYTPEKLNY